MACISLSAHLQETSNNSSYLEIKKLAKKNKKPSKLSGKPADSLKSVYYSANGPHMSYSLSSSFPPLHPAALPLHSAARRPGRPHASFQRARRSLRLPPGPPCVGLRRAGLRWHEATGGGGAGGGRKRPVGRPGGGRRGATREEDGWREVQGAREGEAESVMASVRR